MIVTCKNCNTSFNLSDELVKDTGSKVKCSKCNYIFKVFPPHIQNESDAQRTDSQQEPEEIASTKSYLEPQQQQIEGKESLQKMDVDKDWDLSEVEKILQEENGKKFNGDTLERDKQLQEDYDDFEFGDFDDLFGEE
ncbi:MAG: zinc-ribbon domain-containing protein, partial [Desulfobacterales bacterium]|nr:zinc-ribbon domain-containing protein [Desulfobacterales bacterium]